MTAQNDNGFKTFTAGEALEAFRRVKLNSTTERSVIYADAGEDAIGVTQAYAAISTPVTVKLETAGGTMKMTASAAMATRNAAVYGAADGKVSNTASGRVIGYQLDTASGDGSIIEILPTQRVETEKAAVVAAIDDNTGGTTGGTEQLVAVAAAIDDNTGGTTGGTEQTALTASSIAEGTLGGTTGGTELMVKVTGTGYSAGAVGSISNNLQVLLAEFNQLRTDVANNVKVLSTQCNTITTNAANNFKVLSTQVNAIVAALKTAGLMASS